MTDKLLLPVRIPELGPAFGRLPDRPDPAQPDPLAPIRLRLVTRLLDAAGEARRRAAADEREGALAALASPVWLDAWEEAVGAVADQLLRDVAFRLDDAARRARMGRRHRLLPTEAERRGIASRLGATGAGFVAALDRLEAAAVAAETATARQREAMDGWREALIAAARRLEAAWDTLRGEAVTERATWEVEIDRAAAWRAPWWPVVLVASALLGIAAWIGGILGGYFAAPNWFVGLWQAVVR